MKQIKYILIFFILISCSEEEPELLEGLFLNESIERIAPVSEFYIENGTVGVTNSTTGYATGKLLVGKEKIVKYGHCWSSENPNPVLNDEHTEFIEAGYYTYNPEYISNLSALIPGTNYYVRSYLITQTDTVFSEPLSITTPITAIPTGNIVFWTSSQWNGAFKVYVSDVYRGEMKYYVSNGQSPECGSEGYVNIELSAGTYSYRAEDGEVNWENTFTIKEGRCLKYELSR